MPSLRRLLRAPSASTWEIALIAVTALPLLVSKLSQAPLSLASPSMLWRAPGRPPVSPQVPNALNGRSNSMRNQVVYWWPPQKLRVTSLPSTTRSPTTSTVLPITEWRSLACATLTSTWPSLAPAEKV